MAEAGESLLPDGLGVPLQTNQCSHLHHHDCDAESSSKSSDCGMAKLVIGMVLSIMFKYWISSIVGLILIITALVLYGICVSIILTICGLLGKLILTFFLILNF